LDLQEIRAYDTSGETQWRLDLPSRMDEIIPLPPDLLLLRAGDLVWKLRLTPTPVLEAAKELRGNRLFVTVDYVSFLQEAQLFSLPHRSSRLERMDHWSFSGVFPQNQWLWLQTEEGEVFKRYDGMTAMVPIKMPRRIKEKWWIFFEGLLGVYLGVSREGTVVCWSDRVLWEREFLTDLNVPPQLAVTDRGDILCALIPEDRLLRVYDQRGRERLNYLMPDRVREWRRFGEGKVVFSFQRQAALVILDLVHLAVHTLATGSTIKTFDVHGDRLAVVTSEGTVQLFHQSP
jgi:hypothetical protein